MVTAVARAVVVAAVKAVVTAVADGVSVAAHGDTVCWHAAGFKEQVLFHSRLS